MKVLRPGKINSFRCVCHLCNALLEYTDSDIVNAGEFEPYCGCGTHNDYCDKVQINENWPKIVKDIITEHYDEYTEEGNLMKRSGYVICPECGTHVELDPVSIPYEVYPDRALDYNCDLDYDLCKELTDGVWIFREHIKEYKKQHIL